MQEYAMKFRSGLLTALALALFAPVAVMAADTATPATEAAKEPAKEKAAPKKADANTCGQVTGTRIKSPKQADCVKVSNRPIRSYSAEDLQNTGETDLAAALRQLDPSIR
jgi:hypothetical protein